MTRGWGPGGGSRGACGHRPRQSAGSRVLPGAQRRLGAWLLLAGGWQTSPLAVCGPTLVTRLRLAALWRLVGGWRAFHASSALLPVPYIPSLSPRGRAHYAQLGSPVSHIRTWTRPLEGAGALVVLLVWQHCLVTLRWLAG